MRKLILLGIIFILFCSCDEYTRTSDGKYMDCCTGHGTLVLCNDRGFYVCSDGYESYCLCK